MLPQIDPSGFCLSDSCHRCIDLAIKAICGMVGLVPSLQPCCWVCVCVCIVNKKAGLSIKDSHIFGYLGNSLTECDSLMCGIVIRTCHGNILL